MSARRSMLYAATTALIVSLVAVCLTGRSAITRENAAKIQHGMTLEEVEAILGGPERENPWVAETVFWPSRTLLVVCDRRAEWISREAAIAVGFRDGRVVFVSVCETGRLGNPIGMLLCRLRV
jgi:hypothetical protein